MCNRCVLLLILVFDSLAQGVFQNRSVITLPRGETACSDAVSQELDECWDKLPPVNAHGLPSNPQEIEQGCRIFATGMDCVDSWSRSCPSSNGPNNVKSSIMESLKIYELLCTNIKFQKEYIKHANCYLRISPFWDDCSHKFINTLRRIGRDNDALSLCCIRLQYIQCIDDVTVFHCSNAATKVLHSITESLNSPLQDPHSSQCNNVDQQSCSSSSTAGSSPQYFFVFHIHNCSREFSFFKLGIIFAFLVIFFELVVHDN